MKRKVVQQGPSTYMVSLPKKWVKENKVEKGQEINIARCDGDLIVSSHDIEFPLKKGEIYIDNFTLPLIYRAYRLGYGQLDLKFNSQEVAKKIRTIISNLIGADIIEIERNHFKIAFSNPEIKINKDYYFLKILRLLEWEFKFLLESIFEKKKKEREELDLIYLEVIRRIEFILRSTYLEGRVGEEFLILINLLDPIKQMQEEISYYYDKIKDKKNISNRNEYLSSLESIVKKIYLFIKSNKCTDLSELYTLNKKLVINKEEFLEKNKEQDLTFALLLTMTTLFENFLAYLIPYLSSQMIPHNFNNLSEPESDNKPNFVE